LLDGSLAGNLERNVPKNLTLSPPTRARIDGNTQLDILVHSMGRVNFGCIWDFKGLVYPDIQLNGNALAFHK
jgi:beta-galactosidase